MLIKDIMTPIELTLLPEQPVATAWRMIRDLGVMGLPVTDRNGTLVGMVTRDSLIEGGPELLSENPAVVSIMNNRVFALREDSPITDAWSMHGTVFPVLNDKGETSGVLDKGIVAAELLNKANGIMLQIDTILDSVSNGIIAINKDGIISLYNRAAEKITRRPKSYAMGRHLSEVIIPQGLLDFVNNGKEQTECKLTVAFKNDNRTYLTNRNSIRENGKIVGAVAIFQDISELEQISEELDSVKQLNRKLELIIESSYDGILLTDRDGTIIKANRAHERITGIPSAQIQGAQMTELIKMGVYSHSIIDEVIKAGESVTRVENNHYLVTGNPVRDLDGKITRVVVNIRDLTELNNLKEQLEYTRELSERYQGELVQLRSKLNTPQDGIVYNSPKMREIIEATSRLATVDSTVLILGESGVGKEVIAKLIHNESKRQNGPFITVNCGAIPENLLESELFGYERGAFTGANREGKAGMFELANNGTLFLDEIGDLPLGFQVKLLRVLQEREVLRVGGSKPRPINVRILAATNRNLEEMLEEGEFREDLYFRINVVPLTIPPLRERKEDIIPLVQSFKKKYELKYSFNKNINARVYDIFLNYHWPGNVRELDNMIERLMVTTQGPEVGVEDLPSYLFENHIRTEPEICVRGVMPMKNAVIQLERQLLHNAIKEYGSANKAARALKVNQSTVVRKLSRLKDLGYDFKIQ
ncbi:sigma-54-dependent Fis family transcriptional regulator [Desulfotruncus alcoholivorax]|uniref:sigma-54-dependent Fis family transcriptional regulator n=1 Tax=Desulfotruncus alcoholivorax TaxID=265477 RepID=UPI0003F5F115|nr:sigma-54-dependent Fis family transcriptional regulator [Desulfotruncus alcoholivorax]